MAKSTALDHAALTRILRNQHAVVSREQALACGMTRSALRYRLRSGGPWQMLLPGVYLAVTGTATADQREMGALLHAGPASVITGYAALRRNGIAAPPRRFVDVLVPMAVQHGSRAFVRVHRTRRMPEPVCVDGEIRYVTVPRAIADTARDLGRPREVRALVATAVQRRHCTVTMLVRELEQGPSQGSRMLRAALEEVAEGIRSVAEGDFRTLLKRGRLPIPMFNARLYDDTGLIAIVDAWWPQAGLAVEVDSREWHLSPQDWERTMRRHADLTARGILVLHFTPRQIRKEPATVLAAVTAALSARTSRAPLAIRTVPAAS
ncbi:MAG: hypothetical protein QOJ73_5448 [Streptosporangiaceae bacterium]|jgi:hypothetical protein|nr:hypothetical protein [Streptosporangiaceae bacterium]